MQYCDTDRTSQNDQSWTIIYQPRKFVTQALYKQTDGNQVHIVEKNRALFSYIGQIEHELNHQREHQQDVDILQVLQGNCARKFKKFRLCFLVFYA